MPRWAEPNVTDLDSHQDGGRWFDHKLVAVRMRRRSQPNAASMRRNGACQHWREVSRKRCSHQGCRIATEPKCDCLSTWSKSYLSWPGTLQLMGLWRRRKLPKSRQGLIYMNLGWSSLPSLMRNSFGPHEAWFLRSRINSRAGRKLMEIFRLKPLDIDSVHQLDLGSQSLSGPMEFAINRIDSRHVHVLCKQLAYRYPASDAAASILRNSILRAVADRALDAFYAQLWARSREYKTVVVVGASRWDKVLLDDRVSGVRVTGSVSRACAGFGQLVTDACRIVLRARFTMRRKPQFPRTATAYVTSRSCQRSMEESVLLVLNMSSNFGGLYSYDYLFSDDPDSRLHRENIIVMARNGGPANREGIAFGHPTSGSPLRLIWARAAVVMDVLRSLGACAPWGMLNHLAGVCARVDVQRLEIAGRYPKLKLAILAYDIQVPSELVLALESLGITTAALNERPQSLIWGLQPFSASTLLTASSYFSEAALMSSSVSINSAVAMGMWRTDFLHEYRAAPPHEERERARQAGQKFVVALPYHCAPPGEWSGNPLGVGVQPITHFLEDLADLAERRPDVFIVIRGKNDNWVNDARFSGIAARIDELPNITVSRNYGALNESYRLCARADLVIAKQTSLVDEVLAVGIPCVLHDYTRNSRDLARPSVAYLPRRLWAENSGEFKDAVEFALEDEGAAFRGWWEPHRLRLYGNQSDGSVRVRARAYLSNLEQQGQS